MRAHQRLKITRFIDSLALRKASKDLSAQPRYAATRRGVMQVGLIRLHGSPLPSTSASDRINFQTFFDGAGLALCCEPRRVGLDMCRSAYY